MFPMPAFGFAPRLHIDTLGYYGTIPYTSAASLSTTWPLANKVIYCPIRIPAPLLITELYRGVGSANGGNVDMGIYASDGANNDPGTRLLNTGSTPVSGSAGNLQEFNITDTLIGAGLWYLALTFDNTIVANNRIVNYTALFCAAVGIRVETTGSFGLPATATPTDADVAFLPEMGLAAQVVM